MLPGSRATISAQAASCRRRRSARSSSHPLTPPVGFNLFIIKGFTGDSLGRIARASLPFLLIMVLLVALIAIFPGLVTWLPQAMK